MTREEFKELSKHSKILWDFQEFVTKEIIQKYKSVRTKDDGTLEFMDDAVEKIGFNAIIVEIDPFSICDKYSLRVRLGNIDEDGFKHGYPIDCWFFVKISDFDLYERFKTIHKLREHIAQVNEERAKAGRPIFIINEFINQYKDQYEIRKSVSGNVKHPNTDKCDKFVKSFEKVLCKIIDKYVKKMQKEKEKDGRTLIIDLEE